MNYINIPNQEPKKPPYLSKNKTRMWLVVILIINVIIVLLGGFYFQNKINKLTNTISNLQMTQNSNAIDSNISQDVRTKAYNATVAVYVSNWFGEEVSGSGVIIDKNHILTCQHVVDGTKKVEIEFADEKTKTGKVVKTTEKKDLAVIEVEVPEEYQPIAIAATTPSLGSPVMVIGNNYGMGLTMTDGIVSATERKIESNTYLQTDAAINSGNSGGGLFDQNGNLIGIADMKISKSGVDNVGLAIPTNVIIDFLNDSDIPFTQV